MYCGSTQLASDLWRSKPITSHVDGNGSTNQARHEDYRLPQIKIGDSSRYAGSIAIACFQVGSEATIVERNEKAVSQFLVAGSTQPQQASRQFSGQSAQTFGSDHNLRAKVYAIAGVIVRDLADRQAATHGVLGTTHDGRLVAGEVGFKTDNSHWITIGSIC